MKPCATISSPFLCRLPRRPAADPHPTAQLLLRVVFPQGPPGPILQLPLQQMTLRHRHVNVSSSFSLATEVLRTGHELDLTLALPRRGRKQRLAELEQVLRSADEPTERGPATFDVLVLSRQGQVLHWRSYYNSPGAWRMARVGPENLRYGDTVTFSEGW